MEAESAEVLTVNWLLVKGRMEEKDLFRLVTGKEDGWRVRWVDG